MRQASRLDGRNLQGFDHQRSDQKCGGGPDRPRATLSSKVHRRGVAGAGAAVHSQRPKALDLHLQKTVLRSQVQVLDFGPARMKLLRAKWPRDPKKGFCSWAELGPASREVSQLASFARSASREVCARSTSGTSREVNCRSDGFWGCE